MAIFGITINERQFTLRVNWQNGVMGEGGRAMTRIKSIGNDNAPGWFMLLKLAQARTLWATLALESVLPVTSFNGQFFAYSPPKFENILMQIEID